MAMASSSKPSSGNVRDEAAAQKKGKPSKEFELKKSLLLLASVVATVTYATGLNLPGGVWQDTQHDHSAGDPILPDEHRHRYLAFYYANATAFAASLVVCLVLLILEESSTTAVVVLQAVMALDLLGLMGAYAAGSCRDKFTTIYSALLISAVLTYVVVASSTKILPWLFANGDEGAQRPKPAQRQENYQSQRQDDGGGGGGGDGDGDGDNDNDNLREVLILLATFAVTITYVAGLNPPGGFWGEGEPASDPILEKNHRSRYRAFFVCNTTAFVASLVIVILLLDRELMSKKTWAARFYALYAFIAMALLGLVGAYAAGSCRERDNTTYVVSLAVTILACILLAVVMKGQRPYECFRRISNFFDRKAKNGGRVVKVRDGDDKLEKAQDLVMLLATLVASITYVAGLDPPGGLWQDDRDGHQSGYPVLLTTHPARYKVFFYSISAALVTSLVVIMMVQSRFLLQRHTLLAAMILDLFGLIIAYAAGSCRDVSTSVYVVAMAGVVLIYVVIHIIFFTLDGGKAAEAPPPNPKDADAEEAVMDNRREILLLLAILAATLTYQAGLTPPGGFWSADDKAGHRAGFPVLVDSYPERYKAFFYCNAASFMASVALIVLLVNPGLYRPAIRCHALYVCMVAGMFALMGAYAAGSSRNLRTSIYVLTLVAAVFAVVTVQVLIFWFHSPQRKKIDAGDTGNGGDATQIAIERAVQPQEPPRPEGPSGGGGRDADLRQYLMLLGVLAASVTYQTGLKPPGGLWQGNGGGHLAGDPVLHDTSKGRYLAFFYTNSTSFMASIVVIILVLPWMPRGRELPLWPMHAAILLDMLGLLGAYAAGSSRDWKTSWTVILLVIPVLAYIAAAAAPVFSRNGKEVPITHGDMDLNRLSSKAFLDSGHYSGRAGCCPWGFSFIIQLPFLVA